jgi:hypothetical protein
VIDYDASLPFRVVLDNCNNTTYIKPFGSSSNPSTTPDYSESDINQTVTSTFRVTDACENECYSTEYVIRTSVMADVTVEVTANGFVVSSIDLYLGRYPSGTSTQIKSASTSGSESGATILRYHVKPGLEFTVCQNNKSGIAISPLFVFVCGNGQCVVLHARQLQGRVRLLDCQPARRPLNPPPRRRSAGQALTPSTLCMRIK